jgi:hypothetical protein
MIKTASADMHTKQHTTSLINVLETLAAFRTPIFVCLPFTGTTKIHNLSVLASKQAALPPTLRFVYF